MNLRKYVKNTAAMAFIAFGLFASSLALAGAVKPVSVETFVRAESDLAIAKVHAAAGFGQWFHVRVPVPLDEQGVIRMNRDTLYSSVVLDLSKPVTITMPNADGRYMNLHVISQDHYSYAASKSGPHKITQQKVGSRYAFIIVRTFVDADDPADIKAANGAQDAMIIRGGGSGSLDVPNWDKDQLLEARGALYTLAKLGGNAAHAFGTREEVSPIDHLVYAAAGWGGLPQNSAFYDIETVTKNDGTPHSVTVKNVPVEAFWSVTVYDANGYIEENPSGRYSFNNVTAELNNDGSITINFGGCDDGRINCLPVSKGWNYAVRMYEPREQILGGAWVFPALETVK